MRDKKTPFRGLFHNLKRRLSARSERAASRQGGKWDDWRAALRKKFPENFSHFDFKKADPDALNRLLAYGKWGLIVLGVYFSASFVARLAGSYVRTSPPPPLARMSGPSSRPLPKGDFDAILRRNMFNVEGTIPEPFDQGQLDCFSQARLSTQTIQILGTIVMSDEKYSVALIQEDGAGQKVAVRKDDIFGGDRFQALKVERNRLCFQVRATQEMEYIELPSTGLEVGLSGPSLSSGTEGITPVSENQFVVNQSFLEKNLLNLNEILQTARAVPYVDPSTGKFKGFLIQSMDPSSPFKKLGVNQGDILTAVNDIVLDNAGQGLVAFQRLRNSPKVSLQVLRGGQPHSMSYDIKP